MKRIHRTIRRIVKFLTPLSEEEEMRRAFLKIRRKYNPPTCGTY